MSTITKQWLQQKIAGMEATRDEIPFGLDEDDSNTLAALRIALASLEAEPVAWRYRHHNGLAASNWKVVDSEGECNKAPNYQRQALYASPPAQVSVPEWTNEQCLEFLSIAFRHAEIKGDLELDDIRLGVKMVNGSRAAMLQGAGNADSPTTMQTAPALDSSPKIAESPTGINQDKSDPVTTAYKLPFEQWLSQQTGTIDVECGCVMTEVFFHWLRVAYEAANSSVIPDGVCPCCGRKPLKNRTCSVSGCDGKHVARGFCIKHYAIERKKDPSRRESIRAADKRYRARKAAAPQQEISHALAKGMERYGDAMQELAKKEVK